MFFIKLCWKNIWRNKRRTFLTVNAIGIAVMALVAIHNYYDSFHDQIVDNVIRYHSGHLMISKPGYQKNRSPQNHLMESDRYENWLRGQPEVRSFASRVVAPGLISSSRGSANIAFIGIQPPSEQQITGFSQNVVEGSFFGSDVGKPIVLGRSLADILGISIGSKVVALTQGIDGSIGNELFFVEGIFETHSDADKSLAFVKSEDAALLLSLPPRSAHQISVLLADTSQAEHVRDRFSQTFDASAQALTWKEVQKHVVAIIELDRAVNRLLLGIILMVAALGITNTVLMSIMERTREFGVMMAIGTRTREIVGMVAGETWLLCAIGVLIGNCLGIGITFLFQRIGFDLKWLTSQDFAIDGTIVQTICHPQISLKNSAFISLAMLSLGLIVAIFPMRVVTRLKPAHALRR